MKISTSSSYRLHNQTLLTTIQTISPLSLLHTATNAPALLSPPEPFLRHRLRKEGAQKQDRRP